MRKGLERTEFVFAEDDCVYDFAIKCATKVYDGAVIDDGCAVPNAHPSSNPRC
jgi:hypothetical protein